MAIIPTSGEFVKVPAGGADNRFVVTLTPTAADYSGSVDKTDDEIFNAYISGKEIWVKLANRLAPCTFVEIVNVNSYVDMAAYVILTADNIMVVVKLSAEAGRTVLSNYSTTIYRLTPMDS